MTWTMLGSLAGGIGLFMLGMGLMTDGLKFAAGSALRDILERWTRTSLRGLVSGTLITAVVQSSSAVTVAIIGFVNAGLMTLSQAAMVIYGSNIGTTMTGWLVAVVGLKIDIKLFALPAIGVGMIMRLTGGKTRRGAIGEALTGFGVFFVGIEILKGTFEGLGSAIQFASLAEYGYASILIFVGIGCVLTFLMQSSSAAMAITLSAAAGGLITLDSAAATVIGANIGTTSTAALAVIGATPNAKRVAAAHIAFNLVTGLFALAALPVFLIVLEFVRVRLSLDSEPVTMLALFHTLFNLVGVFLMWPLTGRMVRALEGRFRTAEEDEAQPRHLDHTLVETPALAVDALGMELARIGAIARRSGVRALTGDDSEASGPDREVVGRLVDAVGAYSSEIQRGNVPPGLQDLFTSVLQVSHYYSDVADLALSIATEREVAILDQEDLREELVRFFQLASDLLAAADVRGEAYDAETCAALKRRVDESYDVVKRKLLSAGSGGDLPVRRLSDALDLIRNVRRIAEQAEKASRILAGLHAFGVRDTPSGALDTVQST